MIYLIGGAPRIGKSLIANALGNMKQAMVLSTDELDEQYVATLSEDERVRKFPMPNFSGTPSHNTIEPAERVRLQIVSARSLEPELIRVISDAVENNVDVVVEGIHLTPTFVDELKKTLTHQTVHSVFVGSQNLPLIIDGIMKNTSPTNWLKGSSEEIIKQVSEFTEAFSWFIKREAEEHSELYYERMEDFEEDKKRIPMLLNS